jgi:hypothetical protein
MGCGTKGATPFRRSGKFPAHHNKREAKMRRNVTVFLSAAAALMSLVALLWVAGLARAGPAANPDLPAAGAPSVVSYQGQVSVDCRIS